MESIAVPVSLTVELRPEGADIGSLERAVSAGLAEVGRRLWAELVGTLERSLGASRGHVGCGGILKANITFAIGTKAVFMVLAFTGHASLWLAILADMGASLVVVFNGLRLLRFEAVPAGDVAAPRNAARIG